MANDEQRADDGYASVEHSHVTRQGPAARNKTRGRRKACAPGRQGYRDAGQVTPAHRRRRALATAVCLLVVSQGLTGTNTVFPLSTIWTASS